ncbi:class I lanthipeptide [Taibaiella koreensis]|uniref:class I lanthipeptide n=1 Tax=Taibaiella koreensis TaxID=1268548 RepID=UPI0013C2A90D|nr:class I lanthipeptide [Taibaiella koreensis]
MKKKIVGSKLSLKKKIIAPLSIEGGNQIVGGGPSQVSCGGTCNKMCPTPPTRVITECGGCPVTIQVGCTTVPGTEAC